MAGLKDEKLEDIEKLFNTNVFSLMALTKYCLAGQFNQEKSNYGLINVGSIVGDFGRAGSRGQGTKIAREYFIVLLGS